MPSGGCIASGRGRADIQREAEQGEERAALAKALAALDAGDVLLVTRLDRLARSTRDLLNMLAAIAEKVTCSWSPHRSAGPEHRHDYPGRCGGPCKRFDGTGSLSRLAQTPAWNR